MKKLLQDIEKKIKEKIPCDKLILIDNSYLHKKHKSFDEKKIHLKMQITSSYLKKMKPIESNRLIFSALKDEIKDKIHALQIEIK
ncbi:MAG: hypothetical protein CBC24_03910 [Candidatus Pelagibacter sp. TMED64]|nr:hypothetical protein [Candidatus Pelagibacter sp.]OUU66238.1 MAG: hypothetical protein CBC24_03910 [Candidatus Pelagibacter sp. TMED64]|tara:strand:- start:1850 stop:2104 length:255 start_codon:yes stop_codon:yes gene_type:complete